MEVLAAVVVVATLAPMASGKVPAVLALATGLAVGGILKLAPVPALFAGLSNGGVITVAGVLVIAKGRHAHRHQLEPADRGNRLR